MTVGSRDNDISFNASISNLGGYILVADRNNQPVLGGFIFVLGLDNQLLPCMVVSLTFPPPPEGDRSVKSIVIAPASTGRDRSNNTAVINTDQANSGIRHNLR